MIRIMLLPTILGALLAGACGDAEKAAEPSKTADAKAEGEPALDPFTEYKRKSITSEAMTMLHRIGQSAASSFIETARLPQSAPLTPEAGACCKQAGGKCPVGFAKWDDPAWKALFFELDHPHYYSYSFESTPDGFVARAVGDLDCDGTPSTFELPGKIVDGSVELGELVKTDPLE
jgi:hypothetical protein